MQLGSVQPVLRNCFRLRGLDASFADCCPWKINEKSLRGELNQLDRNRALTATETAFVNVVMLPSLSRASRYAVPLSARVALGSSSYGFQRISLGSHSRSLCKSGTRPAWVEHLQVVRVVRGA